MFPCSFGQWVSQCTRLACLLSFASLLKIVPIEKQPKDFCFFLQKVPKWHPLACVRVISWWLEVDANELMWIKVNETDKRDESGCKYARCCKHLWCLCLIGVRVRFTFIALRHRIPIDKKYCKFMWLTCFPNSTPTLMLHQPQNN